MRIRKRSNFPMVFDHLNFKVGAEVGVNRGFFSAYILANSSISLLHSIDPWRDVEGGVMQETMDACIKALTPFGKRSNIIEKTSVEASKQFKDGELDFVYIDADHRYEYVVEDLAVWYPKVRKGGIFSGHDYSVSIAGRGKGIGKDQTTVNWPNQYKKGVVKAVNEFIKKHGLKLHLTMEGCPSWWLLKG